MTGETEIKAQRSTLIAAVAAVAATYFYFLLYAEFALLELAKPMAGGAEWRVRGMMVALGLGGLLGSGLAAWRCNLLRWQAQLSWAFRGCAVAAAIALMAHTWGLLLASAMLSGASLGWLTVILVSGLRSVVGTARLGWVAGLGTGLAYAACNVPVVFTATAHTQSVLAALVVGAASLAAPFLVPEEPSVSVESDYRFLGFTRWVVMLLLLVWLDSAAFFVIQHEATLQAVTWSGSGHLFANALIHLGAAVGAGWLLDRGWRVALVIGGFALLAVGCLLLRTENGLRTASFFYAAGVSLYSVVLVYFPARGGRARGAGIVYGVAGWIGSALGIGMAQNLHGVPPHFLIGAGAVIGVMAGWRWLVGRGTAVAAVVAVLLVLSAQRGGAAEAGATAEPLVMQGREVYIAEGCIHCHSQYVRAGTADVEKWGEPGALGGEPPLYGNRRQGPDLATVGLRLPMPDWQRAHLMDPRAFQPGSRMPSYAYLFKDGDQRGDVLVAYLVSLGREAAP